MSDRIIQQLEVLNSNSLFGYKITARHTVVLCCCDPDMTKGDYTLVRDISGSKTLHLDVSNNRGYLCVDYSESELIADILNAMLDVGLWFSTQNAAKVCFNPKHGDRRFNEDIMEHKFVDTLRLLLQLDHARKLLAEKGNNFVPWQAFKIWNYRTEAGRKLCDDLRALQKMRPSTHDHKENYWTWDMFMKKSQLTD